MGGGCPPPTHRRQGRNIIRQVVWELCPRPILDPLGPFFVDYDDDDDYDDEMMPQARLEEQGV